MSVIAIDSARSKPRTQAGESQAAENKRTRGYHQLPSTLMRGESERILGELLAGRSIHGTKKSYSAATDVVVELWLRRLESRVRELERQQLRKAA